MDWLARDGLRADQHERYVQPLYEPWAICSLESRSTYRARLGCDDLPSWIKLVTRLRLSFEWLGLDSDRFRQSRQRAPATDAGLHRARDPWGAPDPPPLNWFMLRFWNEEDQ